MFKQDKTKSLIPNDFNSSRNEGSLQLKQSLPSEENLHQGHRSRMRARIAKTGFDGLADHEILEYLLYFSIARGDTNELAHRLINKFNDFNGVLNAPKDALLKIDGVGEKTAELLTAMPKFSRKYASAEAKTPKILKKSSDLWNMIIPRFLGKTTEEVLVICYDDRRILLGEKLFCDNKGSSVRTEMKHIVRFALDINATLVVVAHNHLSASPQPSLEDTVSTQSLKAVLETLGLELLDHVIVDKMMNFYSFMANGELTK